MSREARNAHVHAHQQNINRYCRLLATKLTDHERQFIHGRIVEERLELERLRNISEPAATEAVP